MKSYLSLFIAPLFVFASQSVQACESAQDGCMGCNDEELPVCLNVFVQSVCQSTIDPTNCDARRIYDDAESYVINNSRTHMIQMGSMTRSSHRYQLH